MVRRIGVVALAWCLGALATGLARADGPEPSAALEAALERGHEKYLKGDLDGALAEYTRAIQIEPLFSGSYYGRAKVKWEKSDFGGALSDFTRAIELDPRVAEIYADRGALRLDRGDLAGADADFARALQIDPRCALAHFNRGEMKWNRKDYAGAAADYTRAIESDPRYVRAYIARGNARDEQGDRAGAIADYDRAIALAPKSGSAYYNRGVTKGRAGDREGAIGDYTRAIELDPRHAAAYAARGDARMRAGDLAGALSDFDRRLELGPRSAAAYGDRSRARWRLGDLDGALADGDRAIEVAPDSAVAFDNRGHVRERKGSFDGALSDFTRAIALDPRFVRSYGHRGETRICLREFGAAADDLRKALELDSTYDSARLFLFVAQGLGSDGEAAARAALRANLVVRTKPLDSGSWTGSVCEFLGGRSSADALLAAAEALPQDQRAHARCSAWFYAGMVAWMRGQQASAVELLERCAAANSTEGAEPAVARAALTWPRGPVTAPRPSATGVPDWRHGATSAEEVGLRFAMGLLTGDERVVAGCFDWPSLGRAEAKDVDTVRTGVLDGLRPTFQSMKPEDAWAVVKRAGDGATTSALDGGSVSVQMGAPFQGVWYVAKAVHGAWLITELGADAATPTAPVSPAVAAFLEGWAVAEGTETDPVTGYPMRIRRAKDDAVMVLIPAGIFQMGEVPSGRTPVSPAEPRHAVTLTRAYYLDETEVTVGMWKSHAAGGGGTLPLDLRPEATDSHPIHNVSWDAVQGYLAWARVSLPTEAQWERAAKGGHDEYVYPWGVLDDVHKRNVDGDRDGFPGLAPVRSFPANGYGLYDVSGNVGEWCADWFDDGYYANAPSLDPAGPTVGSRWEARAIRGGAWWADAGLDLRVTLRLFNRPAKRGTGIGFRCAKTLPAASSDAAPAPATPVSPSLPSGAPSPGSPAVPDASGPAPDPPPFAWIAPAEWTRLPDKAMRAATFRPNGSPETEIFVVVLAGTAGGTRASLDRWCRQMGREPLSNAELATLPRGKVLGGEAVFVSIDGELTPMGGGDPRPGWRLFGMVLEREGRSVFVKMAGPRDVVRAEEARVRAFCESFRE